MNKYWIPAAALWLCACSPEEPAVEAGAVDDPAPATAAPRATEEPAAVVTPITEVPPRLAVNGRDITYGVNDDGTLSGYFVLPDDVIEPVPGVVMIHEWWGLTDEIRAMARRLAGEGFAVLAVDLYGAEIAATAADAQRLRSSLGTGRAEVLANLAQAHDYLDQFALAPGVATLGWSMGGDWALESVLQEGNGIDAVVMFYGQPVIDERIAMLGVPLLGIFAADDTSVPVADVEAFRSRLAASGLAAEIEVYANAGHGFMSPGGGSYAHDAAEPAWNMAVGFLDAQLR